MKFDSRKDLDAWFAVEHDVDDIATFENNAAAYVYMIAELERVGCPEGAIEPFRAIMRLNQMALDSFNRESRHEMGN